MKLRRQADRELEAKKGEMQTYTSDLETWWAEEKQRIEKQLDTKNSNIVDLQGNTDVTSRAGRPADRSHHDCYRGVAADEERAAGVQEGRSRRSNVHEWQSAPGKEHDW
jgi:hypothetical protein